MTVAVCEDDAALRSVLERGIKAAGHSVKLARTAHEAVQSFPAADPDVIVLDLGLPDGDGRDVCLALRVAGCHAPVLFLTARDGLHDKIAGFEAGGDDYLTKPFELSELLLRLAALARRSSAGAAPTTGLTLDPARHALAAGPRLIDLTPTEYRLVARLLAHPGTVVRRNAMVAAGWPSGAIVHDNTLDSYVSRLRNKIAELDGDRRIETVRGVGYVFR
jgi:two-component system response regulator MprA